MVRRPVTTVARTCTEFHGDTRPEGARSTSPRPICAFRECGAYVLLGEPGMGKTTEFEQEARALGDVAVLVEAHDLANLDADEHPEWKGKTLFIDALDETRAGHPDPRTPLDGIRRNLDKLGRPPLRLSCRHADWLATDQKRLEAVSPSGEVTVLRLDPLDIGSAAELLRSKDGIRDVGAFIEETTSRGLAGLLANPQSLDLLVRSVHDGAWPASRTETFEEACLVLAREPNQGHLSGPPPKDPRQVLDTAGRLCATLLISGTPGLATTPPKADGDYPYMTASRRSEHECREATQSMLFRYREEGRTEPVHRHIAEYVAGRHVASLIDDGLPSVRVLALMSGPDGEIVSELRGLSAWLAAYSPTARRHLVERDPIGLALYGDIEAFSPDDRDALFRALVREPRRLEPTHRTAAAFAPLATPAMRDVVKRALVRPQDGADGPLVVDFVLRLLAHAPPLPDLAPAFLEIARDGTQWPRVREAALAAFVHYREGDECDSHLMALLRDIQNRRVDDPDDQFLGKLLSALYPRRVSPSMVWDYFKESNELFAGAYMQFWVYELPSRASEADLAELLQSCHMRLPQLEQASNSRLESCAARLLARGLEAHGDDLDNARLYDWLDVGVRLHVGQHRSTDDVARIRHWIEGRPHRHLDLLLEGIRRLPEEHWYAPYEVFQRLFGAALSSDVHTALVLAAKTMSETRQSVADSLVRFAVQSGGLDAQQVRDLVADDARLSDFVGSLLEPAPSPPVRVSLDEMQQARVEEQRRKERRGLETLRAHQTALRENRAPPALLYQLARNYFGIYIGFTPSAGTGNLATLAGSDPELLEAIQTGLRLTRNRDGVPDEDAILEQYLQGRRHYLCEPYLASLAEAERTGSLPPSWWTEAHIGKALAAYFACAHGDYEPDWYKHLIAAHAETVAAVQVRFATAQIREGIDTANLTLWHLAFDHAHAEVAAHAGISLLRAFPARAKGDHLPTLEYLLLAAFQHVDREEFKRLIMGKLSQKSMPPRQRGRWLAAGCAVAPREFADAAVEFVHAGRQQARTLHLASLFCPQENTVFPLEGAGPCLPALLVRLAGRFMDPDELSDGYVTRKMEASLLVSHCIRVLAGHPDPEATSELASLVGDSRLSRWRHALVRAADDQRVNRREHEYRHPTFEQAAEALDGGVPAGPGDLTALVFDRLEALAAGVRFGNTDDWKQYWNEDRYRRPTDPKPEPSCTQALLRDLRRCLPSGVTVEPEVPFANATRADARVSHESCHVPIEVKRNDHRDLWHAASTQLIAKYASDPAASGHGIYVVLWFGHRRTQRSPDGKRPADPNDLKQQLEATLTDRERRTVHVLVLDVTKPSATSG